MTALKVSHEDFIKAWQTSSSVTEVAVKVGLTGTAVYRRSHCLRLHGVPLKDLRRRPPTDWDSLKALAQELLED